MNKYNKLFTPMDIGTCTIKNRYVMEPIGPAGLADESGAFNDKAIEFYVERAKSGVGLIIAGMCYADNTVEWHANGTMPCPTINPPLFKRTAIQLTERIHSYGAKVFIQISAGFGRVTNRIKPGTLPIAPSEVPYRWDPSIFCRAITTEEVESIVKSIAVAASISKSAGFDGVEIHAMHEGYLIDQFAMECTNKRTDKYGGNLTNRIRFAVEIVQEIKKLCGKDFPVVMRYTSKSFMKNFGEGALPGEDFIEMGRDMEEGIIIAKMLEDAGYDALDADVGCYDSWYWNHPPMYFDKGIYLPYNAELKKHISIPILTAGRMDDPNIALEAIKNNATDFIGLARPLLADAQIVQKIRSNKLEEIRPCLSCQEGCIGRLKQYLHISCAVNPAACREKEFALQKTDSPQNIAVLGGGIAGCEAARVLKIRGHSPTIFEKSAKLGGKLHLAGAPDFKDDDRALIAWYDHQIKKLNIPVIFNTEITDTSELEKFDSVIVAIGSNPIMINLGNEVTVVNVKEILEEPNKYQEDFVIVGGGLVGCEAALMLAQLNKKVSIVEALPSLMESKGPLCYANKQMLIDLIAYHKIPVYYNSFARKTTKDGLIIETNGQKKEIKATTVVQAIGYRSDKSLYDKLESENKEVFIIGEARDGSSNILYSVWEAYEVASHL